MTLKEQYKKETGCDAQELEEFASTDYYGKNHECHVFTDEYVWWLEQKLSNREITCRSETKRRRKHERTNDKKRAD